MSSRTLQDIFLDLAAYCNAAAEDPTIRQQCLATVAMDAQDLLMAKLNPNIPIRTPEKQRIVIATKEQMRSLKI